MIKLQDTGLDSNRDNHDDFKNKLLNLVDEHNIKLVIDLHGASVNREFDVEFGTMNNLTADFSTINELKEAFIENGITRISFNNPFKGGAITQYLYNKKDIDVIQLEINYKYRDYSNLENLKLLIESLSNFIKQYKEYRER
jgi:N-formylglutamate amidohydrolase